MAGRLRACIEALQPRRLSALMVAAFALSRIGYWLAGVRFDAGPLVLSSQLLDVELLRNRLMESVFYLHSQPPLFNVLLGLTLKLFPRHDLLALNVGFVAMGLGLYLALFALLRRAGVSTSVALAVSTWFAVSPSFVLYENWLSYTIPVALLLVLSGLLFASSLERARFRSLFALFSVVLVICLVWSAYHLLYLVCVLVGLLVLRWKSRRVIALAALLPLLLLVGLYVKNLVLFGQFTTSSWFGMNFSGVTVRAVPEKTRRTLVARGELTPLALIQRFSKLSDYPPRYLEVRGFEEVPALRRTRKSTGKANLNHLAYVALSREYLRNDLSIVRHHPKYLLAGWLNSWLAYFGSSSDYFPLYGNLDRITAINIFYDYLCYGKIPRYHLRLGRLPIYFALRAAPRLYVFLLVGLPVLTVFGFRLARGTRPSRLGLSPQQRALVLYLCLNIAFLAFVGNTFDVSENQRFRFATDPFSVVLLGLWIEHLRRRSAAPASREAELIAAEREKEG